MSLASSLGVVRNRKGTSTSQPLPSASELAEVADVTPHIRESIATVLSGLDSAVTATLATLLAEGHLLMEDVPGVGKTNLARALAASIDCSVGRIQFAPDLLPSDVTKASIFRAADASLEFRAGPICANVVIADEINRASPKTQSALLEAMARHAVTVDGHTRSLPPPFSCGRHAKPPRDGRHLSASRGATRPLHDPGLRRLPFTAGRNGDA